MAPSSSSPPSNDLAAKSTEAHGSDAACPEGRASESKRPELVLAESNRGVSSRAASSRAASSRAASSRAASSRAASNRAASVGALLVLFGAMFALLGGAAAIFQRPWPMPEVRVLSALLLAMGSVVWWIGRQDASVRPLLWKIAALTIVLRLAQVGIVYASGIEQATAKDAIGYAELALNVAERSCFAEYAGDLILALERPPGYPLFLAWHSFSTRYTAELLQPFAIAMFTQAILATIVPVGVVLLVLDIGLARWKAVAAGVIAAISPTGIASPAMLIADNLCGTLVFLTFWLIWQGAPRNSLRYACLAGLSAAVAAYVKPICVAWLLLGPLVWFCRSRSAGLRFPIKAIAVFLAVQGAFLSVWCVRNVSHGYGWMFSNVGEVTLIDYMGVQVAYAVQEANAPPNRSFYLLENEFERSKRDSLRGVRMTAFHCAQVVRDQWAETRALFLEHPAFTAQAYATNWFENVFTDWRFYDRQWRAVPNSGRWLWWVERIERVVRGGFYLAAIAGMLVAVARLAIGVLSKRFRPAPDSNSAPESLLTRFWTVAALFVPLGYWLMAAGIGRYTGSRLLFPVDFLAMVVPLAVFARSPRGVPSQANCEAAAG